MAETEKVAKPTVAELEEQLERVKKEKEIALGTIRDLITLIRNEVQGKAELDYQCRRVIDRFNESLANE